MERCKSRFLKSFMWWRTLEFASYNFLGKKQVHINVSTDVINFGLKNVYHMTIWQEKIYINWCHTFAFCISNEEGFPSALKGSEVKFDKQVIKLCVTWLVWRQKKWLAIDFVTFAFVCQKKLFHRANEKTLHTIHHNCKLLPKLWKKLQRLIFKQFTLQ